MEKLDRFFTKGLKPHSNGIWLKFFNFVFFCIDVIIIIMVKARKSTEIVYVAI